MQGTPTNMLPVFIVLAVACSVVMSGGCARLTKDGLGAHDYLGNIETNAHFQKVRKRLKSNS
jgi:hypothetical protein